MHCEIHSNGQCNFLFSDSHGVPQGKGFKCTGGIMASEAVSLLRTFYEQGNPNGM